jgi:hypothetical protein
MWAYNQAGKQAVAETASDFSRFRLGLATNKASL